MRSSHRCFNVLRVTAVMLSAGLSVISGTGLLRAQTDTTWVPGSSNWNNAANWSGGFVPHNGTGGTNWNVFVDGGDATNSVVSFDVNSSINQLNISSGDLLDILDSRTLTIVSNGQAGSGTINNDGTILLSGGGGPTRISFTGGSLQINGSGVVTLAGTGSQITGTGTLTQGAGHTIQGNGSIGGGAYAIVNNGTFLAGTGDSLVIDPVNLGSGIAAFTNNGLVRATGGGVVTLTGSGAGEFHGSGVYEAQAGSSVNLVGGAILRNTTLGTQGSGVVRVLSGNSATLNNITNLGNFERSDDGTVQVSGTLANSGDFHIAAAGNSTQMLVGTSLTVSGGGSIRMSGTGASIGGSGLFTNVDNTVSGTGNFGFNSIRIENSGIVRAGAGEFLVIDPVNAGGGVAAFDNANLVLATGGGVITLSGGGAGEFHGTGIYHADAGSGIDLVSSAIVRNTTFSTTGDGVVQVLSGHNADWQNVVNNGNFVRNDDGNLNVSSSLQNSGDMLISAGGNATRINFNTVNLTGAGTVRMEGVGAGIGGTGTLNNAGNTISGSGNFGLNQIFVVNQGLVQAGSGESMTIDPANAGGNTAAFRNDGTVRAMNGGVITLTGNGFGEFQGSGIYEALAASRIDLTSAAILRNTTLSTSGDGLVRILAGENVSWDGVTSTGNVLREDNGTLTLFNSLENSGDIQVVGGGTATRIDVSGAVGLTGGGTIALSGTGAGIGGFGTLTNVDNTISGSGNFGLNQTFVVNQGLVQAGSGDSMTIDPANAGGNTAAFRNDGTVRAMNGGVITLTGNGFGEFQGSGIYEALAASRIDLTSDAIFRNTTLSTSGDGLVRILAGENVSWDGVTSTGNVLREDNGTLTLFNSLENSGDIQVVGGGTATRIAVSGAVGLTGGGTIALSGTGAGIGGSGTLTNVDNTISGSGNFGQQQIFIVNQGLVQTGSGESMTIDPANAGGGAVAFSNDGTVRATGGGVMTLTGNGFGEFAGSGVFEALDGTLSFDSSAVVQNISGGTLNSGTWRSVSTGGGSAISIANTATTDIVSIGANAAVELRGTGSSLTVKGNSIDSTLTSSAGSLVIGDSRVFNTMAGLGNSGFVSVQGAGSQINLNGMYLQTGVNSETRFGTGGSMSVTGGIFDFDEGLLTGNGDLTGDTDYATTTTIAPGSSTGILNITGDASFLGTMQFELMADLVEGNLQDVASVNRGLDPSLIGFDQINIFGNASLDGTMFLDAINGYTPSFGAWFDLITADSLTLQGTFSIVGSGGYNYNWSVLTLPDPLSGGSSRDVLRAFVAVPEPGGLAVLFGIGLVCSLRRRDRTALAG